MKLNIPKITKIATTTREVHTKINTHQNDSNFLTQGHWSKAKLGMQHIHLELL
jgi:hypothetical protein